MSDEDVRLEKLARIVDPKSWELYDIPGMEKKDKVRKLLVRESLKVAKNIVESGLMASEVWERGEYYRAMARIKERTSKTGKCYSVDDIFDGYFMHDPKCERWPDGAIGGTGCIK